jgi:hypothetical protein
VGLSYYMYVWMPLGLQRSQRAALLLLQSRWLRVPAITVSIRRKDALTYVGDACPSEIPGVFLSQPKIVSVAGE